MSNEQFSFRHLFFLRLIIYSTLLQPLIGKKPRSFHRRRRIPETPVSSGLPCIVNTYTNCSSLMIDNRRISCQAFREEKVSHVSYSCCCTDKQDRTWLSYSECGKNYDCERVCDSYIIRTYETTINTKYGFITPGYKPKFHFNNSSRFLTFRPRDSYSTGWSWARLGNHMFVLASLIGIGRKHGFFIAVPAEELWLIEFDLSSYSDFIVYNPGEISLCDVPFATPGSVWRGQIKHSAFLSGYLQRNNLEYISDVADVIRDIFNFDNYQETIKKTLRKQRTLKWIGIHMRYKTRVHLKERTAVDSMWERPSSEWFIKMKKHFVKLFRGYKVCFIIATNCCHDEALNLVGKERNECVEVSKEHTSYEDMAILSACDAVAQTGGTFGWWAAWLSQKPVVYWKDQKTIMPRLQYGMPAEWVGI